MADAKQGPKMERDFSRVILTLENVLIPDDKLSPTPSMQDGLDSESEIDLRILGCEMIQTSGILLKLPQVAMATGQVLFQRFFYSKSFVKHNMEVLAMACVNLASKIEECPRRIRDVINVFHHVKQVRSQKNIHPLVLDQNYINLKNQVIKAERRILKELGFCVHVKHPHKVIVMYLQVLESEQNRKLVQCAWYGVGNQKSGLRLPFLGRMFLRLLITYNKEIFEMNSSYVGSCHPMITQKHLASAELLPWQRDFYLATRQNYMNDSFRTDVFVRWHPETIACACIYMAARQLQVPLPNNPPWYELFSVDEMDIKEICLTILRLYARKKPNADQLEKKVNIARNIQIEAKKKAKEVAASERGTPNSTSRQNSPKNVSPNPTLLGSILRIKKEGDKDRHSDRDSNYKENYVSKKRKNGFSRSRSRSRSRTRSSRSRSSRSFSPVPKKRKHHSPVRKLKKSKYSPEKYNSKEVHKSRKRKQRSHSPSHSVSPSPEYKSSHKKHYKEKSDKYYSPERHSRKNQNGHRLSPSRERYDKYDKYEKVDKYEKYRR